MLEGDPELGADGGKRDARVSSPPGRQPWPLCVGGLHNANLLLPQYKSINQINHRGTLARTPCSRGLAVWGAFWASESCAGTRTERRILMAQYGVFHTDGHCGHCLQEKQV